MIRERGDRGCCEGLEYLLEQERYGVTVKRTYRLSEDEDGVRVPNRVRLVGLYSTSLSSSGWMARLEGLGCSSRECCRGLDGVEGV